MVLSFGDLSTFSYLSNMKKGKAHLIIHGFALLHLGLCVVCKLLGIPDTLILTLATMAMVVILCMEEYLSIEFTAITIVLANVLGFIVGKIGGDLIGNNYLATFITTELLGWGTLLMVKLLKPARVEREEFWKDNVGWLVASIVIVFGLRVTLDLVFSRVQYGEESSSMRLIAEVSAFCLLLLVYFVLHMRNQMELEREKNHSLEKALEMYKSDPSSYKEKLIVHLNNRIFPIQVNEIAYLYAETKSTHIVTVSGSNYLLDESLETLEEQLDPKHFFRISRGCIATLSSIESLTKLAGGRLEVTLKEGIPSLTDLTVSRARVQPFLEWFEG